jgi:mitochondrial fission protein ELM1
MPGNTVTEPNFDWHWCWQQHQLCLQTAAGLHRTVVSHASSNGLAPDAFTLGQAEMYWQCLFALEPLHWPDSAVFAACIDAVAQREFGRTAPNKSFYLQSQQHNFHPQAFDLVEVCGHNHALALVLESDANQSRLMLLSALDTLTGRQFSAGHSFCSLHDRLLPYHPPRTPVLKSA